MSAHHAACGFFGKLPAAGDFVRRGLSASFRAAVGGWLDAGLQGLDIRWSLDNPPWRFFSAQGVLGDAALGGVLAGSRDRVGRSFPILLAAETRGAGDGETHDTWFGGLEACLRGALQESWTPDKLKAEVAALGAVPLETAVADDLSAPEATSIWWAGGEGAAEPMRFQGALDRDALQRLTAAWALAT
jgi:type VI secretion system protein ImpM